MSSPPSAAQIPGRFGLFGGRYVSETLIPSLDELTAAWAAASADPTFSEELNRLLSDYVGRPTPLGFAARLSAEVSREAKRNVRIYLKREDLCHTGAHKINNCIGQLLLARRMGKTRIIAETGAGQHGVATATACALFGLPCEVYMGAVDVERQALNVLRMKLLGAQVHAVKDGTATLKDAMNEALRDWVTNVRTTHYVIGSVAGPHPYPLLVRELQAVIGREARAQIQEVEGKLPDALVACVGGGSNAMGLFHAFVPDKSVQLFGVEAAGDGIDTARHAATLSRGRVGVLHGARSYVLCDDDGQISEAHSISAGLDYPGVGPEHSFFKETGRASYLSATDDEAIGGFKLLARTEGILCALESAHAIAALPRVAATLSDGAVLIVNVSGRGDKDMGTLAARLGVTAWASSPRLGACFARARAEKRAALIVYLTADDPDGATSLRLMRAVAEAGADVIEIGVPWSDPSADGKAIQAAMHRALGRGGGLRRALGLCSELRAACPEVGLVLFGYANPILVMGADVFALKARDAGADGVLCVDYPPDEDRALPTALAREGLDFVPLLAPTSTEARIDIALAAAGSFVYYASMTGITGTALADLDGPRAKVSAIRERGGGKIPVAVGFGIRTPAAARAVASFADAVVVGSAAVEIVERAATEKRDPVPEMSVFVRSLREAIGAVK